MLGRSDVRLFRESEVSRRDSLRSAEPDLARSTGKEQSEIGQDQSSNELDELVHRAAGGGKQRCCRLQPDVPQMRARQRSWKADPAISTSAWLRARPDNTKAIQQLEALQNTIGDAAATPAASAGAPDPSISLRGRLFAAVPAHDEAGLAVQLTSDFHQAQLDAAAAQQAAAATRRQALRSYRDLSVRPAGLSSGCNAVLPWARCHAYACFTHPSRAGTTCSRMQSCGCLHATLLQHAGLCIAADGPRCPH
jgi:hypothetical protein